MRTNSHVPDGWRLVRLGDVLRLEYGVSLPKRERLPGSVPVFGSAGVVGSHSDMVVQGPGIVVGRKGSIGSVTWSAEDFVPIDTTYFAVPVSGCADLRYLFHLLHREDLSSLNRATGVPGLNRDDVYALKRRVPPIEEQRAIAAILDSIDETIERTEEVIAATERLRDALLHDLLTCGLPGRHTEFKQVRGLGTIPASWDVARLGEVAEVNPRRPKLDVDPHAMVTFVPMVAVGEDCSGIIAPERREYREISSGYTYFENDDVLFAKITPCLQNGKHVLASEIANGFGFGSTEFHVLRTGPDLDPRLLYRLVTRRSVLEKCQKSFSGTAGQQRIQPEVLRSLLLPLPPLDEQRAIADTLDSIDQALELNAKHRDKLETSKASAGDVLLAGRARPFLRPDLLSPEA